MKHFSNKLSQRTRRLLSFILALSMVMVTVLSSIGISYAAGDNGLTVKWLVGSNWKGDGDNTNYTMTPSGGDIGVQAIIGINSSTAYPRGTAHFTLPKSLLTYRDGTTCDITELGVQKKVDDDPGDTHDYGAASYWYYEDDGDGNYVFTNCQEIPGNDTKVFSISYTVKTDKVPANTVATITPTNVTTGIDSTGATLTFKNNVDIDSFTKTVLSNGTGVRSLPASSLPNPDPSAAHPAGYWFGRTAAQFNFKDNMYMVYRLDTHTTGNEPHIVSWNDALSAADVAKGAKIVGMSVDSNGLHYVKPIENTTGDYFYGEYDTDNVATAGPDNHIQAGSGWQFCYVLVEYKKTSYGVTSPGDTAAFNNTATATVKGIDETTPVSKSDDADGNWTKSETGDGGGDGSRKYIPTNVHDLNSAAAMLFNNKNVDLPYYRLQSMTWEVDKSTTPSTQPVRDIYMIDDTLTAQKPTGGYTVLGDGAYYLKTLKFVKGVTENYWSDDADAYIGKPDHHGVFEVWASSSKAGAYTKIADRTFDEINDGTNLTVTVPANTVKWYVVYKGDQTSPANQANAYVIFNMDATYTLVGSAPVWDTILPNDTTSTAVSNSVAIPTVEAATGKLTDYTASKDYTNMYQDNWSPVTDPVTHPQRDDLIAADQSNWGSLNPAGRTEVGLPRLWGETVVSLSPVEGMNSTGKAKVGDPINDKPNARAIVNYNHWGYEYYTISGESLDVNIDDLHLSIERDEAVFYDLLPNGMKLLENDSTYPITARGTTSAIPASVTYDVIVNYKGTGRDLCVFKVKADNAVTNTFIPGSVDNPQSRPESGPSTGSLTSANYLQSGFLVNYSTYVPYDSMSDVSVIASETSYQVTGENMLGTAYADQVDMGDQAFTAPYTRSNVSPHYSIKDEDGGFALNNLQGKTNYDPTSLTGRPLDSIYASLTTPVSVPFQADSNLTVKVTPNDGDNAGKYGDYTEVEIGKDYTYRMQYTNSEYITVQDMVLYDTLEAANSSETERWKGTLKRIDTSVAEAKGIKPLIYVATEDPGANALALYDKPALDPLHPGDERIFTNWTVNGPWKLYDASITDPNDPNYIALKDVKAVAIDLGWTNDDQTARYTLPQLSSLSASLVFNAPESIELDDAVNTAKNKQDGLAYNSAGVGLYYKLTLTGEGKSTTQDSPDTFTQVKIIDSRIPVGLVKTDADGSMVGGAKFILTQDAGMGYVEVTDKIVSATASNGLATPSTAEGDIVYTNEDYEPADKIKQTPLKLYPGTYQLTETEAPEGFKLDDTPYDIVVAVDGTVTIKRDGVDITDKHFVNELDISIPSPDITKSILAAIEGQPDYEMIDKSWKFEAKYTGTEDKETVYFASASDASIPNPQKVGAEIKDIDYTDPTYTYENAFGNVHISKPGTYVFSITEASPSNANDYEGYEFDATEYTWTVEVTQSVVDGENQIKVTQTLEDSKGSTPQTSTTVLPGGDPDNTLDASFENTYIEATEEITVIKKWDDGIYEDGNTYSGRPNSIIIDLLRDGELFDSVTLTDADATQSNANLWAHVWTPIYMHGTPTDATSGTASPSTPSGTLSPLATDEDGTLLDGFVLFDLFDTVREAYGEFVDYIVGAEGRLVPMGADAHTFAYTVEEEELDPNLGYETTITNNGNAWLVVNRREVTPNGNWVTWDPPVSKVVSVPKGSMKANPEDKFTFVMRASDSDAPMPEGSVGGEKTVVAGAGGVEFGIMKFTEEGVYTYTLSEVTEALEHYTYDTVAYTMTVTVVRDGADGELKASATYVPTVDIQLDSNGQPTGYVYPTDKVEFNNWYNNPVGGGAGGGGGGGSIPSNRVDTKPSLNSTSNHVDPLYGLNPDGSPRGNIGLSGMPKTGTSTTAATIIALYVLYMVLATGALIWLNKKKKVVA